VVPGGAADSGGVRPGDVIVEFNGRPVPNSDDLPRIVTATKPGTSVDVKVVRGGREETLNVTVEELDLAAEQGRQASRQRPESVEQAGESFGIVLTDLTPQRARQLRLPTGVEGALITDVDPNGPAAGALRPGDVILSVNRTPVTSAAEAGSQLQQVEPGRLAQILLWRGDTEVFVVVRKE
jgi:serine protease Do